MKEELKAPSMVDFVLRDINPVHSEAYLYHGIGQKGWNYAKHLKSQIHLYQLIPCDKNGKPLEKPDYYNDWVKRDILLVDFECNETKCKEYQEAQSRCVYTDWRYCGIDDDYNYVIRLEFDGFEYGFSLKDNTLIDYNDENIVVKTHEDLQRLGVYFTEEFAKQMKID